MFRSEGPSGFSLAERYEAWVCAVVILSFAEVCGALVFHRATRPFLKFDGHHWNFKNILTGNSLK